MMPWPLMVFFAFLIGWPAVKLVTTIISRPRWNAQRRARSELLADYGSGEYEPLIIEAEFEAGKGSLLSIFMPLVVFFAGLAILVTVGRHKQLATSESGIRMEMQMIALRYPEANSNDVGRLIRDPRFREFQDRSFELQALRFPIASFMTFIALIPSMILFGCIEGIRISLARAAKNMIEASRGAVKLFVLLSSDRFLGPPTAPS